jgi:hypothetical protein
MDAERTDAGSTLVRSDYRQIGAPKHPAAAQAIAFWNARPADGIVIGRDVPSRAIASQLNRIMVLEPLEGGSDLKVRVAGDAVQERFKSEIAGRTFADLFRRHHAAERIALVMTAVTAEALRFADCVIAGGSLEISHTEHVILPVFAPGRAARWAMIVCCFFG